MPIIESYTSIGNPIVPVLDLSEPSKPGEVPNRTGVRNSRQIIHDKLYFGAGRTMDFVLRIEIAGFAYPAESGEYRLVKGD